MDSENPDKCLRKMMTNVKNKLTKQKNMLNSNNCPLTENIYNRIYVM